jgi:hypothetical protein
MSVEVVNAVFSGLVVLLTLFTTQATIRARRVAVDRRAYRELQRDHLVALTFVYELETFCAVRGLTPPKRPDRLETMADDDTPGSPPSLPPPPVPAGR